MIDSHVHTYRCGHGSGTVGEFVRVASDRGLAVITFTEHLPLPAHLDPGRCYSMPPEQLTEYAEEVRAAAAAPDPEAAAGVAGNADSPDRSRVKVLLGVEGDWLPDEDSYDVPSQSAAIDADVVLGSVHFVGGWAFDDPNLVDRYETADVDALWRDYFANLCAAAASGLFDVMAHPDLVKKFRFMPSFDPRELYDEAARVMASAGVAVELSTAGLRKPCAEMYPSRDFLERLRAHGVPVTTGSDAHAPTELGYAFDQAHELLRLVGYDSIVYFERREMQEVRL